MRWSTILAIAFCGIDFAGIARIFTPEQGRDEPAEVYYFGAWILAACFNATLTWWGVPVAIVNNPSASGGAVISNEAMTKIVPVFVAGMVLLIRVLIIGTFSLAGDRMFTTDERRAYNNPQPAQTQNYRPASNQPIVRPASTLNRPVQTTPNMQAQQNMFRPAPKPPVHQSFTRPEPTYHNLSGQNNDRSYDA